MIHSPISQFPSSSMRVVITVFCRHNGFSVESVTWRLVVGNGDQLLTGKRFHSSTSRFASSPTPVVITEPFPDRTGSLPHVSKETRSDRQWNVWLRGAADIQTLSTHRQLLPPKQTRQWSTTSTHCRRGCCRLVEVIWHLDAYVQQQQLMLLRNLLKKCYLRCCCF